MTEDPTESANKTFCETCGTEISTSANFCPSCGAAQQPSGESGRIQTQIDASANAQRPPPQENVRWTGTRVFTFGCSVIPVAVIAALLGLILIVVLLRLL